MRYNQQGQLYIHHPTNLKTMEEYTHYCWDYALVELLIEAGAEVYAKDNEDNNPNFHAKNYQGVEGSQIFPLIFWGNLFRNFNSRLLTMIDLGYAYRRLCSYTSSLFI